ncbi:MAG: cation:proton antiporter [Alphaproteobacteria bacterium]|nr:cation:proton antiporter [Alphaproteobacteria bacterium]
MTIFLQLLLILVLTRAFGEGAVRLGQAAAMGELVAGIVLAGLAVVIGHKVPFFAELVSSEVFHGAAQVGIFCLMLLAGIELKPGDIAEHTFGTFLVALGGVLVPLAFGIALGLVMLPAGEARVVQALLIGVAMAITAIPASVRILADLGLVHAPLGRVIIGAALFDDVLGLVLLAVLTALASTGTFPGIADFALLMVKVAVFFAVTMGLGAHVYPRVSRGLRTLQATALEFSALTAVALAYGLLAELLGLHWILGAFMAGLFFEPDRVGLRAYDGIRLIIGGVTAGFFGPIFFASIGARLDFAAIFAAPGLVVLVIVLALLGKMIGAGLPALATGLGRREAAAVGVGMSARGAVELVVLSIAVQAGLIVAGGGEGAQIYSSLVVMAVVTTLAVPVLLRRILKHHPSPGPADDKKRKND